MNSPPPFLFYVQRCSPSLLITLCHKLLAKLRAHCLLVLLLRAANVAPADRRNRCPRD